LFTALAQAWHNEWPHTNVMGTLSSVAELNAASQHGHNSGGSSESSVSCAGQSSDDEEAAKKRVVTRKVMGKEFGQVVLGPPGSGKSTYCRGMYEFLNSIDRYAELRGSTLTCCVP
jgi:hypothetical protein